MKKDERVARQRKQARAVQVREAQRRRRARLRSENQRFLQIIVPDDLRELIFAFGNRHGLTLQEAAVVLVQHGLGLSWESKLNGENELHSPNEPSGLPDFEDSFASVSLDEEAPTSARQESMEDFSMEEPEFMAPPPSEELEAFEEPPAEVPATGVSEILVIEEEEVQSTQEPIEAEVLEEQGLPTEEEAVIDPPVQPVPQESRRPIADDGQMSFF